MILDNSFNMITMMLSSVLIKSTKLLFNSNDKNESQKVTENSKVYSSTGTDTVKNSRVTCNHIFRIRAPLHTLRQQFLALTHSATDQTI